MTLSRALILTLALLGAGSASAGTATLGAIGDSYADEYQFGSTQQPAQNFVEVLSARTGGATTFDFGAFTSDPATRGEPRNAGYEFNWARSGARTTDIGPQVRGLAEQVAAGRVKSGMVFIGVNNFRDILFNGANPVETTRAGIANTVAAASALLGASQDFRLAIANVPDVTLAPESRAALSADPSLAPRFDQVRSLIDTYNANLTFQFARNPRVELVDAHGIIDALSAGPTIGAITIDPVNPGPNLSNLWVDQIHPGTFAQSLLADAFIAALDLTPGPGPDPGPDPTPIPLPAAAWAALAAAPLVLAAVRRMRRTLA